MRPSEETLGQIEPIGPLATETAKQLLSMAESMLGWRLSQARLETREEAVRRYILTQYPLLGRAPSCQEIAAALGLNGLDHVRAILERFHALDLLYLDPESREIRLAYPFSTVPTKHLVRFRDWAEAKPVYAQCAVDALGIPFMLGRDLSILSACAYCEKPIQIEVRDQRIVPCDPAGTVVWVGTAYSGHAATSICPTVDFFCSSAHAAAWWQARPHEAGHVLSVGEALYLGKGIFEDLLRSQPGAAPSVIPAPSPAGPANTATKATSAGGLVAAFLASVCCIGPLVFAALGVGVGATGFLAGTAGVLKALLPYRPLFIGLTAVCLGVSFYLAYRKPSAVGAACEACVPASGFRRGRLLLWIIAGLAAALVLAPYWLQMVTGS
jgi:mercuric ion transport protein